MSTRPLLSIKLSSDTFLSYYFLKKELVDFCKENSMSSAGQKLELTKRIAHFLDTGEKLVNTRIKKYNSTELSFSLNSLIEDDFVFSEKKRAFFKSVVGDSFTFCVPFQRYIKANVGKKYSDAVDEWYKIEKDKKKNKGKSIIGVQFEYNTYIRDFFAVNKGKKLSDAIECWKYKKGLEGHNKYEKKDLLALEY